MMIQCCLNGLRAPGEHPALPVTPAQLAADARAAVAAGAGSLHIHVRDADGAESLASADVAAVLAAVRAAAPGTEVSLSTGLWITGGDVARRHALVAGWTARPELVSLNLSEPGWEDLADLLGDHGVGIEAGLATIDDADRLAAGVLRPDRVLVEVEDDDPVAAAAAIDAVLDRAGRAEPRLHHGYGVATWPVLRAAIARGHDVRIGLEDTFELPDGARTSGNAELVATALRL
jgi:uncharacterized protein (DUF849 family)